MNNILKLSKLFINIFVKASGSTILYHITNSADVFPKPLDSNYFETRIFRSWMKDAPEKAIWLTPNWFEVFQNHGLIRKNVFVFEVDNGLIEEAGGINTFDDAQEIIFNEDLWNKGMSSGKIIPKGKLSEHKIEEMLKALRKRKEQNEIKVETSPTEKMIRRELRKTDYIKYDKYLDKLYDLLSEINNTTTNDQLEDIERRFFELKATKNLYESDEDNLSRGNRSQNRFIIQLTEDDKQDIKKLKNKVKNILKRLGSSLIPSKNKYISECHNLINDLSDISLTLQSKNNVRSIIGEYKSKIAKLSIEVSKALEEEENIVPHIDPFAIRRKFLL